MPMQKAITGKRAKAAKPAAKGRAGIAFKKAAGTQQAQKRDAVTGQFLDRVILDAPVKLSAKDRAEVKKLASLMRA